MDNYEYEQLLIYILNKPYDNPYDKYDEIFNDSYDKIKDFTNFISQNEECNILHKLFNNDRTLFDEWMLVPNTTINLFFIACNIKNDIIFTEDLFFKKFEGTVEHFKLIIYDYVSMKKHINVLIKWYEHLSEDSFFYFFLLRHKYYVEYLLLSEKYSFNPINAMKTITHKNDYLHKFNYFAKQSFLTEDEIIEEFMNDKLSNLDTNSQNILFMILAINFDKLTIVSRIKLINEIHHHPNIIGVLDVDSFMQIINKIYGTNSWSLITSSAIYFENNKLLDHLRIDNPEIDIIIVASCNINLVNYHFPDLNQIKLDAIVRNVHIKN